MNIPVILIGVAAWLCVILLLWGLRGFMSEVPQADRNYQDPLPLALKTLWPLINLATWLIGPRLKPDALEKVHRQLQAAGQDFVLTPEQFYGLRVVGAFIVAVFLCLVLAMLDRHGVLLYLLTFVVGAALGWLYPSLWLSERRKHRQRTVVRHLPSYLDFITMVVEAGMNIMGGIERAAQKGPLGPLTQEFSRLIRDTRSGLPRADALRKMATRMDMPQISSFTGALVQAERVGASLGPTLRAQSQQRREERFLRAEKLAMEAPVKMLLPLVLFFFPLIFMVLAFFIYMKFKQMGGL
ncbi:MAG TPA: type II secretion system F family protein [Rhodanobacteraceae bacterium]